MKRQSNLIIAVAASSLLLLALLMATRPFPLRAGGTYSLSRPNVSAGYSLSQSASYRVAATGGAVDAADPQSGGSLGVTGGFWAGVTDPPPLPPPLVRQYGLYLPIAVGK
jgi:hypothetical protein